MINELVDIGTFLRMHLMPELSHPNINERPIVKVFYESDGIIHATAP